MGFCNDPNVVKMFQMFCNDLNVGDNILQFSKGSKSFEIFFNDLNVGQILTPASQQTLASHLSALHLGEVSCAFCRLPPD